MGPIICAADDSDGARAAIRVARELASKLGTRIVLVHAEPPTTVPGVSAALAGQERLRAQEIEDGQKLLAWLAEEEKLENAELRAVIDGAPEAILTAANELGASFIVIGSRGRGDLKAAVLGSVSSRVASNAPCPVVIVPPGAAAGDA